MGLCCGEDWALMGEVSLQSESSEEESLASENSARPPRTRSTDRFAPVSLEKLLISVRKTEDEATG